MTTSNTLALTPTSTPTFYMVYKFGGLRFQEVIKAREEVIENYGKEGWFIFDRDVGGRRFGGDKAAIAAWCRGYISTLPLTTKMVVDVRNGVGRLGWEEIRAAEERGLPIETFGGPLPKERKYL